MNGLISILRYCLLIKTLVITTIFTNPESASGIICLTKSTCIAIKLFVQLSPWVMLLSDSWIFFKYTIPPVRKSPENGLCLEIYPIYLENSETRINLL